MERPDDSNDETIGRIYIVRRFKNDANALKKLFEMYTQMKNVLKLIHELPRLIRF